MGHTRLGDLPRTRKWQDVAALLLGGASAAQLSQATILAAERGLNLATEDQGLVETVYLLLQLPIAARSDDFAGALRRAGMSVPNDPSLMDVVSAFADAIDRQLTQGSRRDLGEMAQMAATETIASVLGERTQGLFGSDGSSLQAEFARLGTVAQFGQFSRRFFARLTTRVLDYFLSRAYANHVGQGRRFSTLAQQGAFDQALNTHCREASAIVERFSGEWFSKTRWDQDGRIDRDDASHFAFGAMQKMVSELKAGARHGQ